MWILFKKLPLVISIPTIFILMMMIPALHGFYVGNEHQGRTFLYAVLLGLFALGFISLLLQDEMPSLRRHSQLFSIFIFFLGFPILMAIPFHEAMPSEHIINSYLDLVSVFTTTGLPVFPDNVLNETIVIWRVCIGWTSGFLIWVFAWSVFAQLNLSRVDNLTAADSESGFNKLHHQANLRLSTEKFWREVARFGPIYFWITAGTALSLLVVSGDPVFSILRAMSTIATFGAKIPGDTGVGWPSEVILFLVMIFALSRITFCGPFTKSWKLIFFKDHELRLAVILIILAVIILIIVGWSENIQIWRSTELIWGLFFTSMSFLTTTGLSSIYIPDGLVGLGKAGVVFSALAIIGGGVATTAGGLKLLRVYILARHCKMEVDSLIAPSQIRKGQGFNNSINYPNAMLACVFLILFILVFAAITLGLALNGSEVGEALSLTLATLTNTGPLAQGLSDSGNTILELGIRAKLILVLAMVFGRMEVLALLVLLNPDIYR